MISGHLRYAVTEGMAELIPNFLSFIRCGSYHASGSTSSDSHWFALQFGLDHVVLQMHKMHPYQCE